MKYGSLNLLEPSGPHRACNGTPLPLRSIAGSCRFAGRPLADICSMEIMVPQEGETVSSVPGGIFWRPCHISVYNYFRLV
jgi:hypothetical protein